MENCKGVINSFETCGMVDGPGIRFVFFLQGCNMRCKYCHNPETWVGTNVNLQFLTPKEALDKALKYKNYWGKNLDKGGITVSGGEPMLQIDFVTELFRLAKESGINTAIDTSGEPFRNEMDYLKKFDELVKYTDTFIVDLKMFNEEKHIKLTGKSNKNILEMLKYLSKKKKDIWIRRVLVPNLTDDEKDLLDTKNFIDSLNNVRIVEILPYHNFALAKYEKLGLNYELKDYNSPTEEEVLRAEKLLGIK